MIFEHIAITVSDLDSSINFYTKAFNFSILRKTTKKAYLFLDNDLLELMQSISPCKIEKPQTVEGWGNKMHAPIGLSHIGFRVDNLDEAIERIRNLGGTLVIPPYKFKPKIDYTVDLKEDKLRRATKPPEGRCWWRIAVFSDPDGILLELLER